MYTCTFGDLDLENSWESYLMSLAMGNFSMAIYIIHLHINELDGIDLSKK